MTDIELLPLPEGEAIGCTQAWGHDQMRAYARACVAHATAAKDAEIEALRGEVERLQRQLRQTHKDYGCELRDPNGTIWEYAAAQKARAERLAEALRIAEAALADIGDADREPGDDVSWCERRAALGLRRVRDTLRDHDQEVKDAT